MRMTKKLITMLLLVILVGVIPTINTQADSQYDEYAGCYYLAKGETVTFKSTTYSGNVSVIENDGGNKVKVSGKKIVVTGKKNDFLVIKVGKKKIGLAICVGGNNKDSKVNYAEYSFNFKDGKKEYTNYIDCIRDRVKKQKDLIYINWNNAEANKSIKKANRGVYIGERIFDVNDKYPSWCDYSGWTEDNGDEYLCTQCALYYDKKSNCIFSKLFYGLDEEELISGVEWSCWKNNSRVIEL